MRFCGNCGSKLVESGPKKIELVEAQSVYLDDVGVLVGADLKERFRSRDKNWFDRLLDDFEENPDLEKFYTRFADIFIDGALKKANQEAEKVMQKVGLEYATAAKESEKDVLE